MSEFFKISRCTLRYEDILVPWCHIYVFSRFDISRSKYLEEEEKVDPDSEDGATIHHTIM